MLRPRDIYAELWRCMLGSGDVCWDMEIYAMIRRYMEIS